MVKTMEKAKAVKETNLSQYVMKKKKRKQLTVMKP
jgi:hypothetical protein